MNQTHHVSYSRSCINISCLNPISAKPKKWPNTLKQFVGCEAMSFLSVLDHFAGLAFKGLKPFELIAIQDYSPSKHFST